MKTRLEDEKSLFETKNTTGIIQSELIIPFSKRLSDTIGGTSVRSFARTCGLSDKTLRDYLSGKTYPTLDRLALIADASGRSISWLATGEVVSSTPIEQEPLNEQVLQNTIQAIEIILKKKGLSIAPRKKAQIITMIYKLSIREKNIDHQIVKQAIELAS
ncbi:helix-turn-helix domain-containing protein [Vibrio parahaemolyticus]|uniref:helix-turn-helix domain-containing protein n=1 Tax=Vibrio TaxID=662 RepID=UPI0019D43264|nr:helix-turn-helix domain-containing protein [Vibrio vulnificus]MBN8112605.1 helix-turn-helix domain-containing protein [Vibrio vulnificus]